MFNFFTKKKKTVKVLDKITLDEEAKWQAMLSLFQTKENIAFIFWFEKSLESADSFFKLQTPKPVPLLMVREATTPQLAGRIPVFAEHYPLYAKELDIYIRLNLETVQVFSSLKDSLFQQFGGDKIITLMQRLGVQKDEIIEHPMISRAIEQAQEKISKKSMVEQTAYSQAEWFSKNITG
jgi:hypothetical protein